MILIPRLTVRRPHGRSLLAWDDGKTEEHDVLTCGHCQYTWEVKPGSGIQRGFCTHCNQVLCGKPRCMAACTPVER